MELPDFDLSVDGFIQRSLVFRAHAALGALLANENGQHYGGQYGEDAKANDLGHS